MWCICVHIRVIFTLFIYKSSYQWFSKAMSYQFRKVIKWLYQLLIQFMLF